MRVPLALTMMSLFLPWSLKAEGLKAVSPLAGYVCMELSTQSAPGIEVPIRSAPSRTASVVALAASVVIVKATPLPDQGFWEVLRLNGERGWIEATSVQSWHNRNAPGAKCVPSMMSNGRPGFGS